MHPKQIVSLGAHPHGGFPPPGFTVSIRHFGGSATMSTQLVLNLFGWSGLGDPGMQVLVQASDTPSLCVVTFPDRLPRHAPAFAPGLLVQDAYSGRRRLDGRISPYFWDTVISEARRTLGDLAAEVVASMRDRLATALEGATDDERRTGLTTPPLLGAFEDGADHALLAAQLHAYARRAMGDPVEVAEALMAHADWYARCPMSWAGVAPPLTTKAGVSIAEALARLAA